MSRQAHMELAIKHELNVGLGDTIYYVNNGERKSHGDVQKKNKWNATAAEKREYAINNGKPMPPDSTEIVLNCYLIDDKYISETPDKLGEYNIPRYMAAFNKRIEPLLVVFKDEVRDNLLVLDPEKRGLFTKEQCELINGKPFHTSGQDRLQEDVLDISEQELKYWDKRGLSPDYMYELAEEGWEEYIN